MRKVLPHEFNHCIALESVAVDRRCRLRNLRVSIANDLLKRRYENLRFRALDDPKIEYIDGRDPWRRFRSAVELVDDETNPIEI